MVGSINSFKIKGFTIIELLMVIGLIGIVAVLVMTNLVSTDEKARESRARSELSAIADAVNLYTVKYNSYPANPSVPGIPAGIKEFAKDGNGSSTWSAGPWKNSYYDYNAWDIDPSTVDTDTIQIALRFCTTTTTSSCSSNKPKTTWASSFNSPDSAMYYCIKGYCRPGKTTSTTAPGYCINCANNQGVAYPGE